MTKFRPDSLYFEIELEIVNFANFSLQIFSKRKTLVVRLSL